MVKRFILYVPQFSAFLIRCIYQLLVNKVLTINDDVLYLNDVAHEWCKYEQQLYVKGNVQRVGYVSMHF